MAAWPTLKTDYTIISGGFIDVRVVVVVADKRSTEPAVVMVPAERISGRRRGGAHLRKRRKRVVDALHRRWAGLRRLLSDTTKVAIVLLLGFYAWAAFSLRDMVRW